MMKNSVKTTIKIEDDSALNEKTLLDKAMKLTYFWHRENGFLLYFRSESSFVYCHNIGCLNIHGTHVTTNNSINNKFFLFRFENNIF